METEIIFKFLLLIISPFLTYHFYIVSSLYLAKKNNKNSKKS